MPNPTIHRPPPADDAAECALLAAMLAEGNRSDRWGWTFDDVAANVRPEHFSLTERRQVFAVLIDTHNAGDPIDMISIVPRLNAAHPADADYWQNLTCELAGESIDSANAIYYARKICNAWRLRETIRVCNAAADEAYGPVADATDIAATLSDKLQRIEAVGAVDREAVSAIALLSSFGTANEVEGPRIRIPSLLALEDKLDGGIDAGSLIIIGARPSCGKTSLALEILRAQATGDGVPSLFISAEMPTREISKRILAALSGIALSEIRAGMHADDLLAHRDRAILKITNGPELFVLDGVRDVHAIAAQVRHHIRKHRVGLVAVDYLGRLTIRGNYDRHDLRIGAMSETFKNLAADTGVPVILCVQLNRESERQNRAPNLSDLKDSGSIEADADVVILIHREKDKNNHDIGTKLIIAKQRQGQTGIVPVDYHVPTQTYRPARFDDAPAPLSEANE